MRKKDLYILLGVGIGLIVSSMIFYIASFFVNTDESTTLTNEEVEVIARGLGMVYPDEVSTEEPDKEDTIDNYITGSADKEEVASEESRVGETEEGDSTSIETPDVKEPESTSTVDEKDSEIDNSSATEEDNGETDNSSTTEENTGKTISFVIPAGHTSVDISNNLESIGLIDDATKFNNILVANDLDRIIRPNNYTVSESIEEDELIYLITGHKVNY